LHNLYQVSRNEKKSGFFSKDIPNLISAIAGFIAGKYRTGEYFN